MDQQPKPPVKKSKIVPIIIIVVVLIIAAGVILWFFDNEPIHRICCGSNVNTTTVVNTNTASNTNTTTDTSDWLTYENEGYGFTLKYPGNWEAVDNANEWGRVVGFRDSAKDVTADPSWSSISISYADNPDGLSICDFYKQQSEQATDIVIPDYCADLDYLEINVGGLPAKQFLVVPGVIGRIITSVIHDNKIFSISMGLDKSRNDSVYKGVIESFQFTGTTDTSGWQTIEYKQDGHDFSIRVPALWTFSENTSYANEKDKLVLTKSPIGFDTRKYLELSIVFYNNDGTFEQWINQQEVELGEQWWVKEITKQKVIINGNDAYIFSFVPDNYNMNYKYAFIDSNDKVYRINIGGWLENYESNIDLIDVVINTFQLSLDTSSWQTYENGKSSFSFKYPHEWELTGDDNNSVTSSITFTNSSGRLDGAWFIVTINTNNDNLSLEDWIDQNNPVKESEKLGSKENKIVDGISGIKRQLTSGVSGTYIQEWFGLNNGDVVKISMEDHILYLDNDPEEYRMILSNILDTFTFLPDTSDWLTYENGDLDIRFNYPNNYEAPQLIPGISGNADLPIGEWQDIVISLEDFWLSFTARDNYYGRYEGSWSNTFYSKTLDLSKSEDEIKMVIKQDFNNLLYLNKEGTVVEFYELARYGSSYALLYRVMIPHEKYGMILGTLVIKQNYDTKIELDNGYLDEVIAEAQGDVDSIISGSYDNEAIVNINELKTISSTIATVE